MTDKKVKTLEELARMIAEGFNGVTDEFKGIRATMATKEQFEEINQKVEEIDDRLEKIDIRLRTVETKLDKALYTEINRIEARLKKVEEKVGIR